MGFMDRVKGAAEKAQAAMPVGASGEQIEQANRAQRLAKEGIETPAHIDEMTPTGNTDATNSQEYEFKLTVSPPDGTAYDASTRQYVHPSAQFSKGMDVTVKVDPDDPSVLFIWGGA